MPVFPGDPGVVFDQVAFIQHGGYNVTRVTLGTHTGTHVDVPHHCIHSDQTVDRLPLDALVGWAEVLDLGELPHDYEIAAADLDVFEGRVSQGARVLLRTGWSKRFGQPEFFTKFPGLTDGAALWLTSRNVKLVGIEQPSVHKTRHIAVHKALLSGGVVIIESLANLGEITQERVYLVALPLNLAGLDGSPTRVVGITEEIQ
jgi:kynurenine formamidase